MRLALIVRSICLGCVSATAALAASVVTVTLGTGAPGTEIPADFVGLSFETSNLQPGSNGRFIFDADNQSLVRLFRTIGIKNLRIGGGTAEISNYPIPGPPEIDRFFAFARAADVRVIYTLRLLNGDKAQAAALARHITERYADRLDCFSIGNEPDWHSYHSYPDRARDAEIFEATPGLAGSAYPSFLVKWRQFAAAIVASAPGAKFGGPDTGSDFPIPGASNTDSDGKSWTERFAADERGSGRLAAAFHHDYVGQNAGRTKAPDAIDAMLSRDWPQKNYPALFEHVFAPVQALGVPYRMTEANDYAGGVDGASNAFVSALWALDYLHWQAAHGALGVNFHNKRWIYTCTIVQDGAGVFHMNLKGYGLKAFNLGSRGRIEPLELANRDDVNLTAYAARGEREHLVTLINKEHGRDARAVDVTVALPASAKAARAEVIFLNAPNNDPAARTGVTLGGSAISDDGAWSGQWTPLAVNATGALVVNVPPTSAAVVRISL